MLSESEVAQSCPTLCDPMDCSLSGSSVHGIFQARVLEWVAISFSKGSSRPRDWTQVSRIAGRHFTVWATSEVLFPQKVYWVTSFLKEPLWRAKMDFLQKANYKNLNKSNTKTHNITCFISNDCLCFFEHEQIDVYVLSLIYSGFHKNVISVTMSSTEPVKLFKEIT